MKPNLKRKKSRAVDQLDTGKFEQIRRRNRLHKWWGWGLTILAAVNALDFESPFPIPLMGRAAIMASILLFIVGGIFLYMIYRPQVDDALEISSFSDGILSVLLIKSVLGVTLPTAERTIRSLWRKGYLKLIQQFTDEVDRQIKERMDRDLVNFLSDLRDGQRNISQCVFRVPLAADNLPVQLQSADSRQEVSGVSAEKISELIQRFTVYKFSAKE